MDLINYIDKYLSNNLCGFRQGYSAQHTLMVMLENMKRYLDKGCFSGMLLTDLSKAFDCLVHDLLIAKLDAYGFGYNALALIRDYLLGRKQRTKVGIAFSKWSDIILGVPQGSILGPILFNVFINDIFFFNETSDITNYADDNTLFACDENVELVISRLEDDAIRLFQWFKDNYLKSNIDKCHLMVCKVNSDLSIKIEGEIISNSREEKL